LSWVTFSSTGAILSTTQEIDITPTKTELGDHVFSVVFTPDNGNAYTFTWTVTVECTVTAVTPPAAPTNDLTYIVYDTANTFDFTSETWAQTPDCGYDYDSVFTWEGSTSTDAFAISGGTLVVSTSTRSLDASHEVKLVNTLTIPGNGPGGSTTFTPATDADKVVFTIVIEDPCKTTTIGDVDFKDSGDSSVT
jgi:hypothetical protein